MMTKSCLFKIVLLNLSLGYASAEVNQCQNSIDGFNKLQDKYYSTKINGSNSLGQEIAKHDALMAKFVALCGIDDLVNKIVASSKALAASPDVAGEEFNTLYKELEKDLNEATQLQSSFQPLKSVILPDGSVKYFPLSESETATLDSAIYASAGKAGDVPKSPWELELVPNGDSKISLFTYLKKDDANADGLEAGLANLCGGKALITFNPATPSICQRWKVAADKNEFFTNLKNFSTATNEVPFSSSDYDQFYKRFDANLKGQGDLAKFDLKLKAALNADGSYDVNKMMAALGDQPSAKLSQAIDPQGNKEMARVIEAIKSSSDKLCYQMPVLLDSASRYNQSNFEADKVKFKDEIDKAIKQYNGTLKSSKIEGDKNLQSFYDGLSSKLAAINLDQFAGKNRDEILASLREKLGINNLIKSTESKDALKAEILASEQMIKSAEEKNQNNLKDLKSAMAYAQNLLVKDCNISADKIINNTEGVACKVEHVNADYSLQRLIEDTGSLTSRVVGDLSEQALSEQKALAERNEYIKKECLNPKSQVAYLCNTLSIPKADAPVNVAAAADPNAPTFTPLNLDFSALEKKNEIKTDGFWDVVYPIGMGLGGAANGSVKGVTNYFAFQNQVTGLQYSAMTTALTNKMVSKNTYTPYYYLNGNSWGFGNYTPTYNFGTTQSSLYAAPVTGNYSITFPNAQYASDITVQTGNLGNDGFGF